MDEAALYSKLIGELRDKKKHIFGTKYIFDKRAERFGKRVRLLKLFGFLVPVVVGATALGYGIDNVLMSKLITIAIPLSIIQFIISVFAVFYEWDNELAYSFEASQAHNNLHEQIRKLAEFPPANYNELRNEYDLLNVDILAREQQDTKHNAAEWELRKGYRFAMRQYKFECNGCGLIPKSMKATSCDICGNFSWYHSI